jgi:DNA invertase Pin-like site-specific DNA recombinase
VTKSCSSIRCFLDMLGVFAEFETNLRRERRSKDIAKAAGVYKGRPPPIEAARVREMKAQGMRPVDIAKALQIGRASVYRVRGQKADHRRCSCRERSVTDVHCYPGPAHER